MPSLWYTHSYNLNGEREFKSRKANQMIWCLLSFDEWVWRIIFLCHEGQINVSLVHIQDTLLCSFSSTFFLDKSPQLYQLQTFLHHLHLLGLHYQYSYFVFLPPSSNYQRSHLCGFGALTNFSVPPPSTERKRKIKFLHFSSISRNNNDCLYSPMFVSH